jgi:vacuolar-type H+-ATPase catalytic subunit A/Vma1
MYKDKPIKTIADFSMDTLEARRTYTEVFCELNENNFSPRIFYSVKLSFKIDEAIKVYNKQKLKQYIIPNPPLQKILQRILKTEDESKQSHERMGSIKQWEKKDK